MASPFQFSIRNLLVGVTFLAVGMAALVNANGLWQGGMWGLALYALTAAILLVIYRRGELRAYWLGFAVFGWMYLLLFLTSLGPSQFQLWIRSDPLVHHQLLGTQLAYLAHQTLLPASRRQEQIQAPAPSGGSSSESMSMGLGMMAGGPGSGFVVMVQNPDYVPVETLAHVMHALCLLVVAAIGGATCQFIYRTRPADEESSPTRSVSEGRPADTRPIADASSA